jgi:hypothetical protein
MNTLSTNMPGADDPVVSVQNVDFGFDRQLIYKDI